MANSTNNGIATCQQLFGETLVKCTELNNEEPVTINAFDALQKDETFVIGIYFSFVVSEEFTKSLVNLYRRINETEQKFEVVQVILSAVSSPQTVRLSESVVNLPWFAIPFTEVERKARLARRYKVVSGVPTLILLNSDFSTITTMGRDRLLDDINGLHFPWRPRPLTEILKNLKLTKCGFWDISHCDDQDTLSLNFTSDLTWAFYFSANWCPPCRSFTPQLLNTYQLIRKRGDPFEIVFVSSDRSAESFDVYIETMPWLAVPFEMEDIRKELTALFGVQGIPTLVILDERGRIVTHDGRNEILEDPDGLNFPWKSQNVNILTERYATKMHDFPAVVLFIDGDDAEFTFANSILKPIAEKYYKDHKITEIDEHTNCENNSACLQFLIAVDSDTSDILKEFVGLDDTIPLLALVDIPNRKYACLETELTEETLTKIVDSFLNKSLEMQDIRLHSKLTDT